MVNPLLTRFGGQYDLGHGPDPECPAIRHRRESRSAPAASHGTYTGLRSDSVGIPQKAQLVHVTNPLLGLRWRRHVALDHVVENRRQHLQPIDVHAAEVPDPLLITREPRPL